MLKVLCVNPWIYDFAAYDLWAKPLGLIKIAGHLLGLGCSVRLIDCLDRCHDALKTLPEKSSVSRSHFGDGPYYYEEIEKPDIFKSIPRRFKRYGLPKTMFTELIKDAEEPDIILVTTAMTYWYPSYAETVNILKKRFPGRPLILGGIYTNICYEHATRIFSADEVYKGSDLGEIIALINKMTGATLKTASPSFASDIINGYELYNELEYITIRTSSGCPFRCTYCGWYLLNDKYAKEDPGEIVDIIDYFYKKRGIRDFAFYDEALLYEAESHLVRILEALLKKNIKARLHTPNGLHNRYLTADLADLMKRAGFVRPRLALETSSPKRQKETGSKTTNEDFLASLKHLRNAGFKESEIGAYLLIGLPGQSLDEAESSAKFAASHKVRIFLEEYSPIPNTPDYEKSGLPKDADPLLHNNSVFPVYDIERFHRFQKLKTWVHEINRPRRMRLTSTAFLSCLPKS